MVQGILVAWPLPGGDPADCLERAAQGDRHAPRHAEALKEANSQLERRIAERTADLRASNERLKGQIRERRQAEQTCATPRTSWCRPGWRPSGKCPPASPTS
jgi:hypothetical protein